ncbi:hypothetical protein [Pandoraea oxalativorans]|uniref:Uncharacterized protein n=1 Tax=Pandoraea oxalativorans TaxID=573737 RepID=A0A0E3U4P9_9BURK|nr:hypothetical protein [Pandoraea oxalativorans]AKC68474.1 hypothetical protein MB84_01915 [Pandoraea oxalativorans]
MANRGVAVTACANAARSFVIVVAIAALAGCSAIQFRKTETLQSAADGFDGAVKASASALETERQARPRARRAEAVEYYVRTFRTAPNADINTKNELGFARFVCAGADDFVRERAAMRFSATYSTGLKTVLAPGDASIGGQWKRFQEARQPIEVASLPDTVAPEDAVRKCAEDLAVKLGTWKGRKTTDGDQETPFVAIPLAVEAYKAIIALVETGMTAYNDMAAKERFADYVHAYHKEFDKVMNNDFRAKSLENAWTNRQMVALQRPLATFRKIFVTPDGISAAADDIRIRELGLLANEQLAEYDALSASPSPVIVRQKLIDAEAQLVTLVDDKHVPISDLVALFNELKADFEKAKTQYAAADAAVRAVPQAWKQ